MIRIKNYWQSTSPKVKKFGLWVKGLIALVAGSGYIQGDAKLAFYVLVAGAVITGLLELLPPDNAEKGANHA